MVLLGLMGMLPVEAMSWIGRLYASPKIASERSVELRFLGRMKPPKNTILVIQSTNNRLYNYKVSDCLQLPVSLLASPWEGSMCNFSESKETKSKFLAVDVRSAASALQSMRTAALSATSTHVNETFFAGDLTDHVNALSFVDVDGTGKIHIKGSVGLVGVDVEISVATDGKAVTLSLTMREPLVVGPLEWKFNISGNTLSLSSSPDVGKVGMMGLNWLCVAKCAGLAILPTLVACLPTLAGGPPAYIACVTAKVGTADAAAIAACIASKCV